MPFNYDLIWKRYLETCRTPIYKLNLLSIFDLGNGCIDVLRCNITSVQKAYRHVFASRRITLDHLVFWLETILCDFSNGNFFMVGLKNSRNVTHKQIHKIQKLIYLLYQQISQGCMLPLENESWGKAPDWFEIHWGQHWLLHQNEVKRWWMKWFEQSTYSSWCMLVSQQPDWICTCHKWPDYLLRSQHHSVQELYGCRG